MTDFNIFITSKNEVIRVGKVGLDYLPVSLGLNQKWSDFTQFTYLWKHCR